MRGRLGASELTLEADDELALATAPPHLEGAEALEERQTRGLSPHTVAMSSVMPAARASAASSLARIEPIPRL